jgi:hypothetical protein
VLGLDRIDAQGEEKVLTQNAAVRKPTSARHRVKTALQKSS